MDEKWRTIKGYEGLYEVSNMGRVRSQRKILKGIPDKDGYLRVCLSRKNIRKTYPVHRLVAKAFIEKEIEGHNIINHKNENKTDNRAINLEWCDAKYNTNYNQMPYRRAASSRKAIIAKNGNDIRHYESITAAARDLQISNGNISECIRKKYGRNTLKGFVFELEEADI